MAVDEIFCLVFRIVNFYLYVLGFILMNLILLKGETCKRVVEEEGNDASKRVSIDPPINTTLVRPKFGHE